MLLRPSYSRDQEEDACRQEAGEYDKEFLKKCDEDLSTALTFVSSA